MFRGSEAPFCILCFALLCFATVQGMCKRFRSRYILSGSLVMLLLVVVVVVVETEYLNALSHIHQHRHHHQHCRGAEDRILRCWTRVSTLLSNRTFPAAPVLKGATHTHTHTRTHAISSSLISYHHHHQTTCNTRYRALAPAPLR